MAHLVYSPLCGMQGSPCQASVIHVKDVAGGNCHVVRLATGRQGSIFFSSVQLWKELLQAGPNPIARQTWEKHVHMALKASSRPRSWRVATMVERRALAEHGAVNKYASSLHLVSLALAVAALKSLGVPHACMQSLTSAFPETRHAHAAMHAFDPTRQPFPDSLPACIAPSEALHRGFRYGLKNSKRLWRRAALQQQLRGLEEWCRSPVHLGRGNKTRSSAVTWGNAERSIAAFLGFVHRFLSVTFPDLSAFLKPWFVVHFISFLIARGSAKAHLKTHLQNMRRVLEFLRWEESQAGTPVQSHLPDPNPKTRMIEWLGHFQAQIQANLAGPSMQPPNRTLVDGPTLLKCVRKLQQVAASLLAARKNSMLVAHAHQDAAMAACLFGYVPPMRPSWLTTLCRPGYGGPCLHQDCQSPATCPGNKLCVEESSATFVLHVQHHKNSRKPGGHPVHYNLPPDLDVILRLHLQWGHNTLSLHLPSRPPFLFLNAAGGQLTESQLCNQWRLMMDGVGCPALFGPRYCRHIFVNSRRNHPGMAGPQEEGAALAMGSSVRMWDRSYDQILVSRETQAAVNNMGTWRDAVASMHVGSQPVPFQPVTVEEEESPFQSCDSE